MHHHSRAFALVLIAVLANACSRSSADEVDSPLPGVQRSTLVRETPTVASGDQKNLIAGNRAFAMDLYKRCAATADTNLVLSPHSISLALAMTYAGANSATKDEMERTLHFSLRDGTHAAMNWLDRELASRGQNASGHDGKPFRLAVNNGLFGQQSHAFEMSFLDSLAKNYGAALNTVDFLHDADGARASINRWVSDKTESRIQELLAKGALDDTTRLVLVNTIYMNAAWQTPFTGSKTGTFHTKSGDSSAEFMNHLQTLSYASSALGESVDLSLEDPRLALTLVLPKSDMAAFDAAITGDTIDALIGGSEPTLVDLTMPKFKLNPASQSLRTHLQALGMKTAFTAAADFGKITTTEPLRLSDVVHKAFIEVDESGVEAAAATAVIGGSSSAPGPAPEPKRVVFDRPFFYGIRDLSGAWLFVGRVADPSN